MKLMGGRALVKILTLGALVVLQGRMWGAQAPLPVLHSASALVQDQKTGELILQKRSNEVVPIASLTKLVTNMVIVDAKLDPKETITILEEDKDMLRHSHSRLPVGTRLTREQAMLLALMSSENRAAHALGRTYPGGLAAFIPAMNAKAKALGLKETRFGDPAGLSSSNVSSAMDLARIVDAAHHYPAIRNYTTQTETEIQGPFGPVPFHNTNMLIRNPQWQIGLSKTGFIDESGQCLVMQAEVAHRPVLIVLLDATGLHSRFDDANRIKRWMEGPSAEAPVRVSNVSHAKHLRPVSRPHPRQHPQHSHPHPVHHAKRRHRV